MVNTQELDLAIKTSGISKTFIANKLGISRTSLYKKMKGVHPFTIKEVGGLKALLNLSAKQIDTIFYV